MEDEKLRAAVAQRPGTLSEVITLEERPLPGDLAPGEVLVRMIAAAVHPSDAVAVSGAYASRTTFPFVAGFEGLGVIEGLGPEVPAGMRGRRVLPIGSSGTWASHKRIELSWCVTVPEDLPEEAACFAYVNPLTAHLMVERFCRAGVRAVAVTAATSTIGGHLAELLSQRGIAPVGLVRGTPGRTVAAPSLWRDVISTADPRWPERLRAASGGGLDVVLDCVGGPLGEPLMEQLRPGGVFVHFGLLSREPLPAACFAGRAGTRVELFRLRDAVHSTPHRELDGLFRPVFEHLRAGRLLTRPVQRVPLSALPRTLRSETPGRGGKMMIDCGS